MRQEADDEGSHGRVKTKKPMSRPNCGSVVPNGLRVAPQQEGLPLRRGAEPASRPTTSGMRDRRDPAQRLDRLAVVVERPAVGRDRRVDRPGAVGDVEARPDHRGREQRHRRGRAATLVMSWVTKTPAKSTESNQSTSVQNWPRSSDDGTPTTTRIQRRDQGPARRRARVAVRGGPRIRCPGQRPRGSSPNRRFRSPSSATSAVAGHAKPQHAAGVGNHTRLTQRAGRSPAPLTTASGCESGRVHPQRWMPGAGSADTAGDVSVQPVAGPPVDRRPRHGASRRGRRLGPAPAALRPRAHRDARPREPHLRAQLGTADLAPGALTAIEQEGLHQSSASSRCSAASPGRRRSTAAPSRSSGWSCPPMPSETCRDAEAAVDALAGTPTARTCACSSRCCATAPRSASCASGRTTPTTRWPPGATSRRDSSPPCRRPSRTEPSTLRALARGATAGRGPRDGEMAARRDGVPRIQLRT